MSSAKTIVFNCGASHVAAAVFTVKDGSLGLDAYYHEPLDYDYSVEEDWMPALMVTLREMVHAHSLKGKAVLLAPGYQLLTKGIKVPHVEASRRAQIIAYEAQQSIPYPLSEVVWDNQILSDDGVETDVLIIAVKAALINEFCNKVAQTGITPESVQAATVLDYNAYRHVYAEHGEDTLLVNIGARSSNLIFINEEGFFVRNIALGGNSLTQNLADNLGKSFREAEQIKVAFFSGETSFDQDHPSFSILTSNAQVFQKRMSQEITRSIVNYRRQRSAKAPSRVLLTGRGSLLTGLPEFLSESLKVSVDYFDPTDGLTVAPSVDADLLSQHIYSLSELVGEGARSVMQESVSINLLPYELANRMAFARKKPLLIASAAILALSVIPPYLHYQSVSAAVDNKVRQVDVRIPPLQSLHEEIEQNRRVARNLRRDIANLEDLVNSRSNWINFFSDLQLRLENVRDVWLEDLRLDRTAGDRLNLSGRMLIQDYDPNDPAESARAASSRVNALLNSFTESEFINSVTDQRFDTSNPRILHFQFTLIINPENPL